MRGAAPDLSPDMVSRILRDRATVPDALSVELRDLPAEGAPAEGHYMTVTSVIAEPATGRLWASAGPPSEHPYHEYSFEAGRCDTPSFEDARSSRPEKEEDDAA